MPGFLKALRKGLAVRSRDAKIAASEGREKQYVL